MRNLSRYINETGACITNNKFNKQNDASFIRGEGIKKTRTRIILCTRPVHIQCPRAGTRRTKTKTAYCAGIVYLNKKNYTTWRDDGCCTRVYYIVCVFNFEREKISTQIPFLVAQVTRTPKHVLNTLDGWRFSESDRKNVILGGDEGGGGGCGEGGCSSSSSSSSSSRGGGR